MGTTLAAVGAAIADFFITLPEKLRERLRLRAKADLAEGARILAEAQSEADEIAKRAKTEGNGNRAVSGTIGN